MDHEHTEHQHIEHQQSEQVRDERVYDKRTWSPGQIVAAIAGFVLVVLGGVAIARLGFSGSITGETTEVAGFGATRLWAIVEIALGLILLGIASSPFRVRSGLLGMGLLFAAFGVIVAVEPSAFDEALGVGQSGGIGWLVAGIVLILVGWFSPTVTSQYRRTTASSEGRIAP